MLVDGVVKAYVQREKLTNKRVLPAVTDEAKRSRQFNESKIGTERSRRNEKC